MIFAIDLIFSFALIHFIFQFYILCHYSQFVNNIASCLNHRSQISKPPFEILMAPFEMRPLILNHPPILPFDGNLIGLCWFMCRSLKSLEWIYLFVYLFGLWFYAPCISLMKYWSHIEMGYIRRERESEFTFRIINCIFMKGVSDESCLELHFYTRNIPYIYNNNNITIYYIRRNDIR